MRAENTPKTDRTAVAGPAVPKTRFGRASEPQPPVRVRDPASAAGRRRVGSGDGEGVGYVHFVGTHPEHAGKSLGYWMTAACLHEFRRLGLPAAVLHTDDHRIPAVKTYLKLGFAPDLDAHPSYRSRWDRILAAHPELASL